MNSLPARLPVSHAAAFSQTETSRRAQRPCLLRTRKCLRRPAVSPRVTAAAPATEAASKKARPGEKKGFVEEMRFVAMKLHTRDQAPKEGQQPASPQPMQKWEPSTKGYLQFLAESQVVYSTLDQIVGEASHPEYARFQNTGLERTAALEEDIKWMQEKYDLPMPQLKEDGPGYTYANFLKKAAKEDPPVFICHLYNFYFAHTAGGRMIGSKISSMILDNANLRFYQYEGDYKPYLENVRDSINDVADEWSRESKDHCLEETKNSFSLSNGLLRLIFSSDEAESAQPGSYSKSSS